MRLKNFIETPNKATTLDEVVQIFLSHIQDMGFQLYICSLVTDSFPDRKKHHGFLHNYPEDWIKHYRESNYIDNDPVFERGRREHLMFYWSTEEKKTQSAIHQKIDQGRRDAGLLNGYSLFIHLPGGAYSSITVANGIDINHDKNLLTNLCLCMYQFHLRNMYFLADLYQPSPPVFLAPRECETLIWCARGKSNYAIASILGISEKTVEFYFTSLFQKLNVESRTVAVLKAISLRLIAP